MDGTSIGGAPASVDSTGAIRWESFPRVTDAHSQEQRRDSSARERLALAFETMARWHHLRGRPEVHLFSPPGPEAPDWVTDEWDFITQFSASDWSCGAGSVTAAEQFNRILLSYTERETTILKLRVFADTPLTLDELGSRLQVTRERVRQVESRLLKQLRAEESLGEVRALASRAVRGEVVLPLGVILGESPALSEIVHAVDQPLWRVLDRLDESFEVKDGWWCTHSCRHAIKVTKAVLADAAKDARFVDLEAVSMLRGRVWAADWVAYSGGAIHEGHALLKASGIPDRAAITLEVEGAPLSIEELADRIGPGRATSSIRNALASDNRFARVDRNLWALAVWGMGVYRSIRQLIADEVVAHGGGVRLSKLIERLTDQFSVSASSVTSYASAPPFATVDGVVELATRGPAAPRKSPYETKRLFRLGDRWALRVNLNSEHFRGSGWPLPSALIAILGLEYGEPKYLTSPHGDQRVGWSGPQATLGSIKRIIESEGLEVGDPCFLIFGDNASFDLIVVNMPEHAGSARAYALAGLLLLDPPVSDRHLAESIGLPSNATRAQVAERLRERGDYDIADNLLPAQEA